MQDKKILVVTYYWPPAGGPGVQRWLKFVKYLPDFGWKPTVFIPENPSYPILDETLLEDVPKNLHVIKMKILEPYSFAEKLNKNNKKFKAGQFDVGRNQSWKSKLSIWIRGNFFIPDARFLWVRPSTKFLKKFLKENHYEVLVTTGPPHSVHLIGLHLKHEFPNLKWVADFRDPWTDISYYKHLKLTASADRKHKKLEKEVMQTADIVMATSYSDAENFTKKGAHSVCITNGFDVGEIVDHPVRKRTRNAKFTLSYIGVLEQLRNPEVLWTALQELVAEDSEFKSNFELKFVGKIDDRILYDLSTSELSNNIKTLGYLSHDEAFSEMMHSDLLLITNFPSEASKGIIPGKIFEYLATGNTILSFGPKDADVSKILNKTKAGAHFMYNQKEEVKLFIQEKFIKWKSGDEMQNTADIAEFSRKNITKRLAEIL